MAEILHKGKRLQIRKATMDDLDFILKLEYDPENLKFIVPFDRDVHTKIIEEGKASMEGAGRLPAHQWTDDHGKRA